MRASATAPYLQTIRYSHDWAATVDVYLENDLLIGELPFTDGTVTADRGSEVRYTLSLTVPGVELLPRSPTDPLAPYGQTLRAYRGAKTLDGTTVLVECGVFVITSASGDRDTGPITIQGSGREFLIQEAKLTEPWSTAGQISHATVITDLILDVIPDAVVDDRTTGDRVPATKTWDVGADRWAACRELATAIGAEVYADAGGVFVIADIPPDPATVSPVWDVDAGPGGVLVSADTAMNRDGVYNGVRASGENATDGVAGVSALVVDDDPVSPTRWGGPFGKKLYEYKSPLLVSTGDCETAAEFKLVDLLGPNTTVSLTAAPNAGLEPGDCIRTVYTDGERMLHTVESVTIPLGGGECSIRTRSSKEES